jgi:hypothetical protein
MQTLIIQHYSANFKENHSSPPRKPKDNGWPYRSSQKYAFIRKLANQLREFLRQAPTPGWISLEGSGGNYKHHPQAPPWWIQAVDGRSPIYF